MIPKRPPFDAIPYLAKVGNGCGIREYQEGDIVFSQGDRADAVFYLQSGRVKSTIASNNRKKAVVAILGRNEFFGEKCLAGHARRLSTAEALTKSVVIRVEKTAIQRVIRQEPAFADMFVACLLDRTIRVEADLTDHLCNSSEKRLARLLLLMANFGAEGKPKPIIERITQETLAAMVGTTRSRVSYFMNKFRQLGLIEYNGSIKVHRSLLRATLHDKAQIKH